MVHLVPTECTGQASGSGARIGEGKGTATTGCNDVALVVGFDLKCIRGDHHIGHRGLGDIRDQVHTGGAGDADAARGLLLLGLRRWGGGCFGSRIRRQGWQADASQGICGSCTLYT